MSRRQHDTETAPMVVTTLRLPKEKLDRFREIAALEHRSTSGEMRRLIDERIADHDGEAAAA